MGYRGSTDAARIPPPARLGSGALLPPRLAVMPELTEDDVDWLNRQLQVCACPAVRYARELPPSPPGRRPPADTSWIEMTTVRR